MSNLEGGHFVAVEVLSLCLSNNQPTWHDHTGHELPPAAIPHRAIRKRATSGRQASARSASGLRADDKHQRGVQAGYERTTSVSEECKRATSGRRASARSASGLQTNKLLKRPRLHFLLASNHIHHHRHTGQILSNALVGYRRGIELIFEMVEHKSSRLHSSGPH